MCWWQARHLESPQSAISLLLPGELKFGSAGIGTGTHFGAEKFNLEAGIKAVHVPGDTMPQAIADTVAGRTSYLITPISYAEADIRASSLRALGVTTKRRSPLLPDVPTIAEVGVAEVDYPIWYGVWVRTGTPAEVVNKTSEGHCPCSGVTGSTRLAGEARGRSNEHDAA